MGVGKKPGLCLRNRDFLFVRTMVGEGLRLRGSFRGMKIYTLQWTIRSVPVQTAVGRFMAIRTVSDHDGV